MFADLAVNLASLVVAVALVVAVMTIGEAVMERRRWQVRRSRVARLESVARAEERRIQRIVDQAESDMYQAVMKDSLDRLRHLLRPSE